MNDLKQCPFCGAKDARIACDFSQPFTCYTVACNRCGSQVGIYIEPEKAKKAWNARYEHTCIAHQECLSKHMENCIVRFSCGHMICGLADEYHYCPHCGAKVVADD